MFMKHQDTIVINATEHELRKEAIAFSEWCNTKRWIFTKGVWMKTLPLGTTVTDLEYSKKYVKKSEQLYSLFKQSNNENHNN